MNVFNAYEDTYYPRELSTDNWNASGVSRATNSASLVQEFGVYHYAYVDLCSSFLE